MTVDPELSVRVHCGAALGTSNAFNVGPTARISMVFEDVPEITKPEVKPPLARVEMFTRRVEVAGTVTVSVAVELVVEPAELVAVTE